MKYQYSDSGQPLYMRVYEYYKNMIADGTLKPGQKIPSVRRCSEELEISRTTVENAYMSLAADGYIIAKKNSGFYVTDIRPAGSGEKKVYARDKRSRIVYDFASAGADSESFDFNLWRRYIKSALRQDARLLSYGEPQGEYELRETIASYISASRNVICSPENIVIGAGVQTLFHILCAVTGETKRISFRNPDFRQGIAVFRDHGWEITDERPDVIYVNPSNMNKFGDVMGVEERFRLIRESLERGQLIIEDDYGSEFSYFSKRTPSLQSLSSGKNVVYTGTFSRLLLPSIRMSYMVLPDDMLEKYLKVASDYNQTASKTEQIALCQFIRDGHMDSQIRKLRKLYSAKSKYLADTLKNCFGGSINILTADNGLNVMAEAETDLTAEEIHRRAVGNGISLTVLKKDEGRVSIILSCTSVKSSDFGEAVSLIRNSVL